MKQRSHPLGGLFQFLYVKRLNLPWVQRLPTAFGYALVHFLALFFANGAEEIGRLFVNGHRLPFAYLIGRIQPFSQILEKSGFLFCLGVYDDSV